MRTALFACMGMERESMNDYSLDASRRAWEENAAFWDAYMGDASNRYHREVVRPYVTELLAPQKGDFILDAACGNGNYSAFLAECGAQVVAFDYSPKMAALARARRSALLDRIEFCVADAADPAALAALRRDRPYTKAVCNMALMDMTEIAPLFKGIYDLLAPGGLFVFATQHPCFVTLTDRYRAPHAYLGEAIHGQPVQQCYYHRSLTDLLAPCFAAGFSLNGLSESYWGEKETPDVLSVRLQKA